MLSSLFFSYFGIIGPKVTELYSIIDLIKAQYILRSFVLSAPKLAKCLRTKVRLAALLTKLSICALTVTFFTKHET